MVEEDAAAINDSSNVKVTNSNITRGIYGGGNGESLSTTSDATGDLNPAKIMGNTIVLD